MAETLYYMYECDNSLVKDASGFSFMDRRHFLSPRLESTLQTSLWVNVCLVTTMHGIILPSAPQQINAPEQMQDRPLIGRSA
jgi:hypothetical protein